MLETGCMTEKTQRLGSQTRRAHQAYEYTTGETELAGDEPGGFKVGVCVSGSKDPLGLPRPPLRKNNPQVKLSRFTRVNKLINKLLKKGKREESEQKRGFCAISAEPVR